MKNQFLNPVCTIITGLLRACRAWHAMVPLLLVLLPLCASVSGVPVAGATPAKMVGTEALMMRKGRIIRHCGVHSWQRGSVHAQHGRTQAHMHP